MNKMAFLDFSDRNKILPTFGNMSLLPAPIESRNKSGGNIVKSEILNATTEQKIRLRCKF